MRLDFATTVLAVAVLAAGAVLQAQAGRRVNVLDANTASEQELLSVPHVTPALAAGIAAERPFPTVTDLDAFLAKTLSQAQRTAVYRRLFVQLNLNTASDGEILLIPGVGPRMLGEFREYRPYRGLAQFRREIGKYVDATELARFEQYVFVPIDLNSASDAEILTIPGVGQRLLHEFKEYRPYRSLAQFRREIGKYVSDEEVSRLERYVTLN